VDRRTNTKIDGSVRTNSIISVLTRRHVLDKIDGMTSRMPTCRHRPHKKRHDLWKKNWCTVHRPNRLLAEKGKKRESGAPASPDWQVVKQDNWTCKQGPVQKHSQLHHSTVRSRKKKKMSRKINLSIELMNKRRCKILLLTIVRQSWPGDNYNVSLKCQYNEWWQLDRPTTPM